MDARSRAGHRESAGFVASLVFVCLASVRDVYFGRVFQWLSPLDVAMVAFLLCIVVFLPIALLRSPGAYRVLLHRRRELFWVNATTAVAWISFFYALRAIEPLLVQILFGGIGPVSVVCIDRLRPGVGAPAPLGRTERSIQLALLVTLLLAAAIPLVGLSGAGPQPPGTAALGVLLALGAGMAISVSTVLSRTLNDGGVDPAALVSVRFVGAVALAAGLALVSRHDVTVVFSGGMLAVTLGASAVLIVLPIYVNQVGISLASPLTVRVVLAVAPVIIFVLQLVDGRLSPSPYSLACGVVYGALALAGAIARRQYAMAGAVNPRRRLD